MADASPREANFSIVEEVAWVIPPSPRVLHQTTYAPESSQACHPAPTVRDEVARLSHKNKQLLGEIARLKQSLSARNNLAVDLQRAWNELRDLKDSLAYAEEQFVADSERLRTECLDELRRKQVDCERLEQEYNRLIIENAIYVAIGDQASHGLLMPYMAQRVRCIVENGERRLVVLDDHGQVRLDPDGTYMTVRDLVAELQRAPEIARFFHRP